MMPRIIVRDLKDGEEITITGEKSTFTPGEGFFTDSKSSANYLEVKTITARGKTVDVEKEFAGAKKGMDRRGEPGSMKGKGGMKGGRGCCGE